jgi:hypothetical protein
MNNPASDQILTLNPDSDPIKLGHAVALVAENIMSVISPNDHMI